MIWRAHARSACSPGKSVCFYSTEQAKASGNGKCESCQGLYVEFKNGACVPKPGTHGGLVL